MRSRVLAAALAALLVSPFAPGSLQGQADPRLDALKNEALEMVEDRSKQVQEIVGMLFSFGELGFQEFETQRYLTGILEDDGFEIDLGVAGRPAGRTAPALP